MAEKRGYWFQMLLPFAASDPRQLQPFVDAMMATTYLKPTHIGVDERKRKRFTPEELQSAVEYLSKQSAIHRSLFLWHEGCTFADLAH